MNQKNKENKQESTECKNCKNHFQGLYCNECGQKAISERNTLKHFFNLIFESFDVHRGVLHSAILLFKNPGKIIHDYLDGRTKDYYNPLKYLLIIISIYAILVIWSNVFDLNVDNTQNTFGMDETESKLNTIINGYIKKYMNILTLISLPFISLISMWIFKKLIILFLIL